MSPYSRIIAFDILLLRAMQRSFLLPHVFNVWSIVGPVDSSAHLSGFWCLWTLLRGFFSSTSFTEFVWDWKRIFYPLFLRTCSVLEPEPPTRWIRNWICNRTELCTPLKNGMHVFSTHHNEGFDSMGNFSQRHLRHALIDVHERDCFWIIALISFPLMLSGRFPALHYFCINTESSPVAAIVSPKISNYLPVYWPVHIAAHSSNPAWRLTN